MTSIVTSIWRRAMVVMPLAPPRAAASAVPKRLSPKPASKYGFDCSAEKNPADDISVGIGRPPIDDGGVCGCAMVVREFGLSAT